MRREEITLRSGGCLANVWRDEGANITGGKKVV